MPQASLSHPTLRVLAQRINDAEGVAARLFAAATTAVHMLRSERKNDALAVLDQALREAATYSRRR